MFNIFQGLLLQQLMCVTVFKLELIIPPKSTCTLGKWNPGGIWTKQNNSSPIRPVIGCCSVFPRLSLTSRKLERSCSPGPPSPPFWLSVSPPQLSPAGRLPPFSCAWNRGRLICVIGRYWFLSLPRSPFSLGTPRFLAFMVWKSFK